MKRKADRRDDGRLFMREFIERDPDPDFLFSDYGGERMTLQDCLIAFDRTAVRESGALASAHTMTSVAAQS